MANYIVSLGPLHFNQVRKQLSRGIFFQIKNVFVFTELPPKPPTEIKNIEFLLGTPIYRVHLGGEELTLSRSPSIQKVYKYSSLLTILLFFSLITIIVELPMQRLQRLPLPISQLAVCA